MLRVPPAPISERRKMMQAWANYLHGLRTLSRTNTNKGAMRA
jgi:hypothetical protein